MSTELVPYQSPSFETTLAVGETLAASGYFQDAREAAQAVAKILAGQELGIGPLAAMTGIYIVKGRVTLSANLIAAQIKRSGRYNYIITRLDDHGCAIDFYENGKRIGPSTFTADDAKNAGLLGGDNWKKFPRNMYFARALSNGARWYTPDIFNGPVYTADELTDASPIDLPTLPQVNPATGEVQADGTTAQPVTTIRLRMKQRVFHLQEQYKALGGNVTEDDLFLDLDRLDDDELTAIGIGWNRRVAELREKQTPDAEKIERGVVEESLPL